MSSSQAKIFQRPQQRSGTRRRVYSSSGTGNGNERSVTKSHEILPQIQQGSQTLRQSTVQQQQQQQSFLPSTNTISTQQQQKHIQSMSTLKVKIHTPFISRPSSSSSSSLDATVNSNSAQAVRSEQSARGTLRNAESAPDAQQMMLIEQQNYPAQQETVSKSASPGLRHQQHLESRVIQEVSESENVETQLNMSQNEQLSQRSGDAQSKQQFIMQQEQDLEETPDNQIQNHFIAPNTLNNTNNEDINLLAAVNEFYQQNSISAEDSATQEYASPNTATLKKKPSPDTKKNYQSRFFKELRAYSAIQWGSVSQQLSDQQKYVKCSHLQQQRVQAVSTLYQNFLSSEIDNLESREDIKLASSLLLDSFLHIFEDEQQLLKAVVSFLPEQQFIAEHKQILELFGTVLRMEDPDEIAPKRRDMRDALAKNLHAQLVHLDGSISQNTRATVQVLRKCLQALQRYDEIVDQVIQKVRSGEQEIKQLREVLKDYEIKASRDIDKIAMQNPLKFKSKQQMMDQLDETLERLYLENIKDLQKKFSESEKEREKLQLKLKERERAFKQTKDQLEKLLQRPHVEDRGTQINLMVITNKPQLKKNPYAPYTSDFVSPFTFSKNCTSSLVSLAFSDKVVDDYQRWFNRKQPQPLVAFVCEWFLKTFGNKVIGQLFLKNFVQSIEEYQSSNKRFWLFSVLSNMEDQQRRQKKLTVAQDIKAQFLNSATALNTVLRLSFIYRQKMNEQNMPLFPLFQGVSGSEEEGGASANIVNVGGQTMQSSMLMSMSSVHEQYMCPLKKALQVVESVIVEHFHLSDKPEQVDELLKAFEVYAREDLKQRKRALNPSSLVTRDISAIKHVSLDVIAAFVLEHVGEAWATQVESFLQHLRIAAAERRNGLLSIDDFCIRFLKCFPHRSREFAEECFCKFYLSSADAALAGNEEQRKIALQDFLEAVFLEDTASDFYLRAQFQQVTQHRHSIKHPHKKSSANATAKNNNTEKDPMASTGSFELPLNFIKELTYDLYASTTVLNECYDNIKNLVRSEEGRDERIKIEHENLKLLLAKLQSDSSGIEESKIEGIDIRQRAWVAMRKLLDYTSAKIAVKKY